jgi:ABC-type multidrug transport system ATPase subunit
MHINLKQVGKRFGRHWIIRDFDADFRAGETIGVRGRNGSGKSTLLRILAGQLTPSRGKVSFSVSGKDVGVADRYRHVSWTGPYLEIVEELTIVEFLAFHFKLKPLRAGLSLADLPKLLELDQVRNRKLADCSSGMRQRVLLGSALFADTPLLLLDEPSVTLDETAVAWFHQQLAVHTSDRLVFVASNDADDLRSCTRMIDL